MNTYSTSRQRGFTVIELVFVATLLTIAGIVTFVQFNNLTIANRDADRKTAINAIHYSLEEVYFKQNQSYPQTLTSAILPSVEPALFTDPDGFTLGKEALNEEDLQKIVDEGNASPELKKQLVALSTGKQPNYHYDATGCDTSGHCTGYTLRADLQSEAQYIKKNR